MLIASAILAASLSASAQDDFVFPDMPDVDATTREDIDAYMGWLQSLVQQIESVETFGAFWSRFISEGTALVSDFRVRDPYLLTANLTTIYANAEANMPNPGGEYSWAIGMDFNMERNETVRDDGTGADGLSLPPLPEIFCAEGEHTVMEIEASTHEEQLDLCLAYGPDDEHEGHFFAEAQIVHRYAYALTNGSAQGFYDIHAAASISDESALELVRRTTRDLAQAVAEQIYLDIPASE